MNNNNEYRRSVGVAGNSSGFSSNGNVKSTSSYDTGSTTQGGYVANYKEPDTSSGDSREVQSSTSSFGGYTASYNGPDTLSGGYTASYNGPDTTSGGYTASYKEPDILSGESQADYSSISSFGGYTLDSDDKADYGSTSTFGSFTLGSEDKADYGSTSTFGSFTLGSEESQADYGSTSTFGSFTTGSEESQADYSSTSTFGSFTTGSEESTQNGMGTGAYQSLYSDYDSTQTNTYQTSTYSAPEQSSAEEPQDSYGESTGSYSAPADSYSASANSYSAPTNSYNAPKDEYTAPSGGFNYDYGSSTSSGKDDYKYDSYDSAPTKEYKTLNEGLQNEYRTQELPQAGGSYSSVPLDKKGRPLKNRFGLKLILSVVEIVFATLWGILSLVFTCMANNAYNQGDWDTFQSKSKMASIMLWIGLIFTVLSIAAITFLVGAGVYSFKNLGNQGSGTIVEDIVDVPIVGDDNTGAGTGETDFVMPDAQEYNSFKFNGTQLALPGAAEDFINTLTANGYTFEYDAKTTHIKPHAADYLNFYNGEGYVIGFMEIYNTTDEEIYMIDGVIGGINIDVDWDDNVKIDYLKGITNKSDIQDYIEVLGTPSSADDQYNYYNWSTEEGWIEISLKDGKLSNFTIYAYTMLQ